MKIKVAQVLLSMILLLSTCKPSNQHKSVTVFCAAGLVDVITELSDSFKVKNSIDLKMNIASSGTLARQIEQGNPADIYISASKQWADYADSLSLFSKRKPLYRNRLVFICPLAAKMDSIVFRHESPPEFEGYLSMGDPAHVPAGKYARQALKSLRWWKDLESRVIPAKDVRSALIPVELGECELGIVYYSDALASQKVKIVGVFPDSTHSPIIFHALLSKTASEEAEKYYSMLTDTCFQATWLKYGLTSLSLD